MTQTKPFVILALPRSRTAWLAKWLSGYGARPRVGHDLAIGCASVAEFWARLDNCAGTVETGVAMAWPLLLERLGPRRLLVVRRQVFEVETSLARLGLEGLHDELLYRAELLDQLSETHGVITVQYPALRDANVCAYVWQYLLGIQFDLSWLAGIAQINVQVDIPARLAALAAASTSTAKLKSEVLALLTQPENLSGMAAQ